MTVKVSVPDFAAARRAMIESQLRPVGVTDQAVLEAMGSVPREQFVPDGIDRLAGGEKAIDCAPTTLAGTVAYGANAITIERAVQIDPLDPFEQPPQRIRASRQTLPISSFSM